VVARGEEVVASARGEEVVTEVWAERVSEDNNVGIYSQDKKK
jgi:hypothetical protein